MMICVHSGSEQYNLNGCPDITNEQLVKDFIQLDEFELDNNEGLMLFQ